MKRLVILAAGILLVLTFALAQKQDKKTDNPDKIEQPESNVTSSQDSSYTAVDQAYKREFENERVRVTRVHYKAHEIIETHDHPKLPTVYVYLSDSGPIQFIHTGEEKFTTVRPAVKAGGFRLGRSTNETHKVESLSDQASDFLRVELKDLEVDRAFRGRFPPEIKQTAKSSEKVGFENPQVRIVRVTCASRSVCPLAAQKSPYLLVAFTSSELKTAINEGALSDLNMRSGQTLWVESNDRLRLENPGNKPVRFLRIELKAAN